MGVAIFFFSRGGPRVGPVASVLVNPVELTVAVKQHLAT